MTRPSEARDAGLPGLLRVARLSRAALDANLAALLASRSAADAVVDVRADAYGHGLSAIVGAAAEHGIRRFRVSPGAALAAGLRVEDGPIDAPSELAAYGLALGDELSPEQAQAPVLTLVGEVVAVKQVPAGSAVSYGYTYRTERSGTIALVGLGYADGVPRLGSNTAHAAIEGVPAIVAGRIAMDQFVLDLDARTTSVGEEVTVWGDPRDGAPALRDWAAIARRSPQQVTAGLGWRVARTWIDGRAQADGGTLTDGGSS